MRAINLDQLRSFVEVADSQSFSAAARKLNLSQPAVSIQIRELERKFSVKLIERFGKKAQLTLPGAALADAAQEIFDACSKADAVMRVFREGWIGRVRIASTTSAQIYILPAILRQLHLDHPGIDLHLRDSASEESVRAVLGNQVDLAVVTMPIEVSDQIKIMPLLTERMLAIYPAHEANIPDIVRPEHVLASNLLLEHVNAGVYKLVMQWLSGRNQIAHVRMHLGTIEAVKGAVASGLGMSILPEMAANNALGDIVVRQIEPPLLRTLALLQHKNKSGPALDIVRTAILTLESKDRGRTLRPKQNRPQKKTKAGPSKVSRSTA